MINLWSVTGQACGQYLYWQIRDGALKRLLLHQALRLGPANRGRIVKEGDPVIEEIMKMSSATMDRCLKPAKEKLLGKSVSTTQSPHGTLRNEIPFGKSYTERSEPGWLSIDTVVHFGGNAKGNYIWTLNATDVLTGWTETESIRQRSASQVKEGHEERLPRFSFPIMGANYDGGSEFINTEIIDYAKLQNDQMTRSRPYLLSFLPGFRGHIYVMYYVSLG